MRSAKSTSWSTFSCLVDTRSGCLTTIKCYLPSRLRIRQRSAVPLVAPAQLGMGSASNRTCKGITFIIKYYIPGQQGQRCNVGRPQAPQEDPTSKALLGLADRPEPLADSLGRTRERQHMPHKCLDTMTLVTPHSSKP